LSIWCYSARKKVKTYFAKKVFSLSRTPRPTESGINSSMSRPACTTLIKRISFDTMGKTRYYNCAMSSKIKTTKTTHLQPSGDFRSRRPPVPVFQSVTNAQISKVPHHRPRHLVLPHHHQPKHFLRCTSKFCLF